MAWVTLQLSDVQSRLTTVEISAVEGVCGATDPVGSTLSRVVNLARGYVANQTVLDQEGTIPEELSDAVLDLFVVKFLSIVPSTKSWITLARQNAADEAMKLLRAAGKGDFRVEPATTPAASQPPPKQVGPTFSRGPRSVGRGRGIGRYEEGA